MIIGSAGHIDHGKTALIRALTGIEADRLGEEKRRGMTIDLGFAYQNLADGGVLGFVDVPGHERFVPNMLSGALAVDYVMLVVAADDGPMPQSREHLAIVDLLGLDRGIVVMTKCDRVDRPRRAAARDEIRQLLAAGRLADANIVEVSSITGAGIAALHERLVTVAGAASPRVAGGHFRLAVDRAFSLSGTGTVATGTVHAGRVAIGDRLIISPQGLEARVRGIHCQGRAAERAVAGERCAVNLAGRRVSAADIHRGDWIVAEPAHAPSARLDARLRVLASAQRALTHWQPVHVHIGAADVPARVAVLEGEAIAAGESARVQLVLDRALPALTGDRFVVRDQSATHTVGGGTIIDPFAPGRGRRKPQRLAILAALETADHGAALAALADVKGRRSVDALAFARARNLTTDEAREAANDAGVHTINTAAGSRWLAESVWTRLGDDIVALVDQHHQREPASPGMAESELAPRLAAGPRSQPPAAVIAAAVAECLLASRLQRNVQRLCRPSHRAQLSPEHERLWTLIQPRMDSCGLRPPRVRELAEKFDQPRETIGRVLRQQAVSGGLWQVSDDLYYPPRVMARLAADTQAVCEASAGRLTVKSFREGTGASRNVAVELLEFFDRIGLTARVADGRRLLGDAAALFGRGDTAQ